MRQGRKRQRHGCVLPLITVIGILTIFLLYNKAADGLGFSKTAVKTSISDTLVVSGTTNEEKLKSLSHKMPKAKKLLNNIDEYPTEIVELLLRNPETLDFVLDYPQNKNGTYEKPNISKDIKKGEVPHFLQWDKRWGYDKYGSSNIAISGCGPTCLSMVYTALTGSADYDPKTMAEFSSRNGYYIEGSGTSWKLMTDGAKQLGLNARELSLSLDNIKNVLNEGKLIIASLGPGDFTTSGHFIVIYDKDKKGRLKILDPNSNDKSKKTWEYNRLSGQILNLWSFSK